MSDNMIIDEIHDVVIAAINSGWDAQMFIAAAADAWAEELAKKRRDDSAAFAKARQK